MIVRQVQGQRSAPLSARSNNALPHAPAKQIPRVWDAVRAGVAMIAKRIVRERGASNFRRLGRYILDGAAEEEQAVMARMAEYILGAEKSRAANVRFSNPRFDGPKAKPVTKDSARSWNSITRSRPASARCAWTSAAWSAWRRSTRSGCTTCAAACRTSCGAIPRPRCAWSTSARTRSTTPWSTPKWTWGSSPIPTLVPTFRSCRCARSGWSWCATPSTGWPWKRRPPPSTCRARTSWRSIAT